MAWILATALLRDWVAQLACSVSASRCNHQLLHLVVTDVFRRLSKLYHMSELTVFRTCDVPLDGSSQ